MLNLGNKIHRYSGSNCGLKRLQQLKEIWRAHTNNLRNIRLHRARKHDKYAKELQKYLVVTQVLVRNFTRKPLEKKFVVRFSITRVLSNNSYQLLKPNGRMFRVNVHHMRPYGTSKGRKTRQPANVNSHNSHDCILRNGETLNSPNRLTY